MIKSERERCSEEEGEEEEKKEEGERGEHEGGMFITCIYNLNSYLI